MCHVLNMGHSNTIWILSLLLNFVDKMELLSQFTSHVLIPWIVKWFRYCTTVRDHDRSESWLTPMCSFSEIIQNICSTRILNFVGICVVILHIYSCLRYEFSACCSSLHTCDVWSLSSHLWGNPLQHFTPRWLSAKWRYIYYSQACTLSSENISFKER